MRPSLTMLISIASIVALGKNYDWQRHGDILVVWPKINMARIERQNEVPLPDCDAIYAKIKRLNVGIERCSSGGTQPLNYCELLSGDLRRTLLGFENELLGTFEPDAHQRWTVSIQPQELSLSEIASIAEKERINREQIQVGTIESISFEQTDLQLTDGSYSQKMAGAPILGLPTSIQAIEDSNGTQFQTNNRLTACELASGKIRIQVNGSVVYGYTSIDSYADVDGYWRVAQAIQSISRKAISNWQKAILAGFTFADYQLERGGDLTEESVLYIAAPFVGADPNTFVPVAYSSKYDLAQKVLSEPVTFRRCVTLEGRVK